MVLRACTMDERCHMKKKILVGEERIKKEIVVFLYLRDDFL
jgi:hypothetical protein